MKAINRMRYHPDWFVLCYLSSMLGILSAIGCGGGSNGPGHTDYLAHLAPVHWEQEEILYRVSGGTGDSRRAVRRGFGRWEDAMQGYLRLREARDGETEHITARFTRLGGTGGVFFGNGRFERVIPTHSPTNGKVMSSAIVEFDGHLIYQLGQLERFAAHSMGHVLYSQGGNGGHSPYPSDLLYGSPGVARPSPADINTFRLVYGGAK